MVACLDNLHLAACCMNQSPCVFAAQVASSLFVEQQAALMHHGNLILIARLDPTKEL